MRDLIERIAFYIRYEMTDTAKMRIWANDAASHL